MRAIVSHLVLQKARPSGSLTSRRGCTRHAANYSGLRLNRCRRSQSVLPSLEFPSEANAHPRQHCLVIGSRFARPHHIGRDAQGKLIRKLDLEEKVIPWSERVSAADAGAGPAQVSCFPLLNAPRCHHQNGTLDRVSVAPPSFFFHGYLGTRAIRPSEVWWPAQGHGNSIVEEEGKRRTSQMPHIKLYLLSYFALFTGYCQDRAFRVLIRAPTPHYLCPPPTPEQARLLC
jgi:hypothetical protein